MTNTKKTPLIDEAMCIGCTLCTQVCPNVYAMGDTGKSHVINSEGDSIAKIQESIDACPIKCIFWKEE
jgi:ferredoxin